MKVCPSCGSPRIHPSRPRTLVERLRRALSQSQPYRCHACGFRGWAAIALPHQGPDHAPDDLRVGGVPKVITGDDLDRLDKT
jgi:predicted RNA-binding Zn-ribbon protein involved in translation (DUF1610 family)